MLLIDYHQYWDEYFSKTLTISVNSFISGLLRTKNVPYSTNPMACNSSTPPKVPAILFWKALFSVLIFLNLGSVGFLIILSK